MPIDWDPLGDFDQVVDTLESVTWKRVCEGDEKQVNAWRFSESASQHPQAGEALTYHDTVWQIPYESGDPGPQVGDRLIEADSTCWTIHKCERLRGPTRYRCEARRVSIRRDLAEWFDLEEAVWDLSGPAPVVSGWKVTSPPLRGCAVLLKTEADLDDLTSPDEIYLITVTEPLQVTTNHRFRTHAGRIFSLPSTVTQSGDNYAWSYEVTLKS